MTTPTNEIGSAYSSARAWADGPARVYDRLSDEIIREAPSLGGGLVLDLGAGTGSASRALARVVDRIVALDLSEAMLRIDQADRPSAVVGDALSLPFRAHVFDAVVSAFVVSHVTEPLRLLYEAVRVARPGGSIVAATFAEGSHDAKEAFERCAEDFGYRRPSWYDAVKREAEPLTASQESLRRLGAQAGLDAIRVIERQVDSGLRSADDFIEYRLGMPSFAAFARSLDAVKRASFVTAARRAIGTPDPFHPTILILAGTVATDHARTA